MSEERQKCNRCKVNLLVQEFDKNRSGVYFKTCITCKKKLKCVHGKTKQCCKKCGGSSFCIHDKIKSQCRECGGSSFCIHDKLKYNCRDCDGSNFCIHDKRKYQCRDCDGSNFCIHDKVKSRCRDCDGSAICIHDKNKYQCRDCDGSAICIHDRRKLRCRECDPMGYTTELVRNTVRYALKSNKSKKSIEYLGCSILAFREHIEKQFIDGMSWENQGAWHIDHRIPIKYNNPTDEEIIERLHYKNCQPLWACDNLKKGNRYIG